MKKTWQVLISACSKMKLAVFFFKKSRAAKIKPVEHTADRISQKHLCCRSNTQLKAH